MIMCEGQASPVSILCVWLVTIWLVTGNGEGEVGWALRGDSQLWELTAVGWCGGKGLNLLMRLVAIEPVSSLCGLGTLQVL